METNSSFFGISFTGENANHVPYTHCQVKIWTITLWKWEINTCACTYLCQLFPLMYLFQSFNKNYTFWPCKSPTVNKHFKVTNKIPFLSFPQPWIQSSSWGVEQGIRKSTRGPCLLSHWSPHLFLKRIRARNSFKIYNSFHSEGWKSGLRNLEVSSMKVQGREVPRDLWHTDIFSSFTKLTKLRSMVGVSSSHYAHNLVSLLDATKYHWEAKKGRNRAQGLRQTCVQILFLIWTTSTTEARDVAYGLYFLNHQMGKIIPTSQSIVRIKDIVQKHLCTISIQGTTTVIFNRI